MNIEDENRRIANLPRRDWETVADVEEISDLYRTPNGSQTLRPIQAAGLFEGKALQGLFKHGRVGCGKTLTAGLLPQAWECERPVLVVRGADVGDTNAIHKQLRRHWLIPRSLRVISYNFLSDPENAGWLDRNKIDGLVLDEAQKAKDIKKSSCAINIRDFLKEHTHVPVAALSGSLSPHGDLDDYAHILLWCLRNRAPIPNHSQFVKRWARILRGAGDPSGLLGAWDHLEARDRFKHRLAATPGVIVSVDKFDAVPLHIKMRLHDASEASRPHFEKLREFWEAPDGWCFAVEGAEEGGQLQVAECARQLANGFWYGSEPRFPDWFLEKRRAWAKTVSDRVEKGVSNSEGHLKLKLENGLKDPLAQKALDEWLEAKEAFPYKTKAEWIDLDAVLYARDWIRRTGSRGIVWVQHIEVGRAIEKLTGCKFFNGQPGRNILKERGDRCVVASIQACGTSKNLQKFNRNLFLNPVANGEGIEQALGRTHREGQKDPVHAEFYISCREHRQAVIKSIRAAEAISDTLSPQKMAGQSFPKISKQDHPAWLVSQKARD